MSDAVTTSVEVAVSPEVAFDVFVREIDAWYRVDRRALPDLTRTAAIRFEPRLGGRLIDVHDPTTGDGRELARITTWEPGRQLVFLDNEGTEVDVRFERAGERTRVTLTHRGLDQLTPSRAAALRRTGWRALTHLYRDHVAPNARPFALAAVSLAVVLAASLVLFAVVRPSPGWMAAGTLIVSLGIMFVITRSEKRLARRWVASDWSYRQIKMRVIGLLCLGFVGWSLYRVFAYGDDPGNIGIWYLLLFAVWLGERGPAEGRSLRKGVKRPPKTFLNPRLAFTFLLLAGVTALFVGAVSALGSIDPRFPDIAVALTYAGGIAFMGYVLVARRRENRARGFDPDYYLAVERRIGDENRRPELLIHRPSKKPEYSGWYAYANDQGERPRDLVTWSMQDLIDHSPEAAHPLREGHGKWRWDERIGAYKPIRRPHRTTPTA